ncbi:hypothetical protein GGR21_002594 [Dysgonomonas hofstadii]|uniref:Uncharacterized protein n=1 Tax=Dysgonomonas hofstadii TaxID=637886 RepID=A0A840CRB2_9BACT|nr:hypothetical protein [Dysgonomonas hofstadii]
MLFFICVAYLYNYKKNKKDSLYQAILLYNVSYQLFRFRYWYLAFYSLT